MFQHNVYKFFLRYFVNMKGHIKKEIEQWYEEYKNGSTIPRLAQKFQVSTATIRNCFKKHKFKTRTISEGVKFGNKLMS